MNRFNLTFSGEIVAGHDQEEVKRRFAALFAIDDQVRLDRFFSGETIILRRNLERKDAAQCYHELQLLGAVAALVTVTTSDLADDISKTPPPKVPVKDRTTTFIRSALPRKTKAPAVAQSRPTSVEQTNSLEALSAAGAVEPSAPDSWPLNTEDAAAAIKSRRLAAQRMVAEEAAQEKAAAQARQRVIAEEEAREQVEAAANLRLAEQERAQQAAEQARMAADEAALKAEERAKVKRLAEEEAVRKSALKAAAKRKAAEEAAQRKVRRIQEKAEKAHRKAEEKARRKAELEEQKRLAAEEEARRTAELEEQKRLAAEEEARRRAELEEQKRLATEEEARRRAELEEQKRLAAQEEARRRAKLEEQKRLAAEEEARRRAELEEQKRLAAKEEARRRAELEEQKRLAAQEEARRKGELESKKRQAAKKKARRKAALEKKKRLAAETDARRLAEIEEKKSLATEDKAHSPAAQHLQEKAERKSAESRNLAAGESAAQEQPQIVYRSGSSQSSTGQQSTAEPATQRSQKPAKTRVKTTLDVPLRKRGETPEVGVPGQRKRQSGIPNLYKLRPFRNSQEVRTRAAHARQRMRRAYTVGAMALVILLIAGGSFLQTADNEVIAGASAVAINGRSEPLLLTGHSLLFHDRAGVSTTEVTLSSLGVAALKPPLVFNSDNTLIALGRLSDEAANPTQSDVLHLLRCDLARQVCEQFSPQLLDNNIDAFVINPLDDNLLLADSAAAKLLKVDSEGAVVASAAVAIPINPVLRLHGGLLLMNSKEGPAISVFRYEDSAFGKQLDEILLLPPAGQQVQASRIGDFIFSGNAWWVNLRDQASGSGQLHRFDESWNYLNTVPLASDTGRLQLTSWGDRTLVNNPRHPVIQRFNALGLVEAPFVSTLLQDLIGEQQQRARLASTAWRVSLLMCSLVAVLSFGFGYLHSLRALVYSPRREQGAEPLDNRTTTLRWIEPAQNRQLQLRRTGMLYGLGGLGTLLLAIAMNVSVWQLAALMLALSGPAIALLLLNRHAPGYIGIVGDRLLLVDHSGLYHLAGGPRLHYHGPFLSIDDIVVFSGSRLLPAFSPVPLHQHIRPPALGAIKVDHKTIAIKLLECRHPLALGVLAIAAGVAAAALLLMLQDIF